MPDQFRLKAEYSLARCCNPTQPNQIIGYHSHTDSVKVHSIDCSNLSKADQDRLVTLKWDDILENESFSPGEDYNLLSTEDFKVLRHHLELDIDYSLKVARDTGITKDKVFEIHNRLKEMKLIKRIDSTMVRYRKKQVDHKWIKHRNHTYYQLTKKGRRYIEFYLNSKQNP